MGGDHGLSPNVEGAIQATRESSLSIILVGDEPSLKSHLDKLGGTKASIEIFHASQVVDMHESPALIARKKRDSSIWKATELVKNKQADALVSAGNTGATMVSAFFLLGLIQGVERPAIAATLPTRQGKAIMLDVGATVDCTARQLFQFGIMGHEYGRHLLGTDRPRVGLLSIGEEDTKGNEVTKETFKLLKDSPINFIGNAVGVKEGGILQETLHKLDVECLPRHIPEHLEVDITNLNVGDSIYIRDLQFENITILNSIPEIEALINSTDSLNKTFGYLRSCWNFFTNNITANWILCFYRI